MDCRRFFLFVTFLALLSVSCRKLTADPEPEAVPEVYGEWIMESWSGSDIPEVYAVFGESGVFELYQRVYDPFFHFYTGTFTWSDGILSGSYSDNIPWGDSYEVSFSDRGTRMILSRVADEDDVSVFVSGKVPEEVRQLAVTRSLTENGIGYF